MKFESHLAGGDKSSQQQDIKDFQTDRLEGIFHRQGQLWPVTLLPGIGHIPLTLDPGAMNASVKAVEAMSKRGI